MADAFTGLKFNLLTAVKLSGKTPKHQYWLFKCDCGTTKVLRKDAVQSDGTKSCGCVLERSRHYLDGTKFNFAYKSLLQRCRNPKNKSYRNYGGRGIRCLWENFLDFKRDIYDSFIAHEKLHGGRQTTIERINNDGHYCKENCRWATVSEQNSNRRHRA